MIIVKEKKEIRDEFPIFPVKFRIARAIKNCTLEELANESGVTRKTIANIEKGYCKSISNATFLKLANALRQHKEYFMSDV